MTRQLNGTYFFMYKNFEDRFLETNFFYPAVKIESKLFNRFNWMKRYFIDNSIFKCLVGRFFEKNSISTVV